MKLSSLAKVLMFSASFILFSGANQMLAADNAPTEAKAAEKNSCKLRP